MYYTSLSKIIDDVFAFPYGMPQKLGDPSFVYDSIKTEKDGSSTISVVIPGFSKENLKLEACDGTLKLWSDLEERPLKRYWKISDSVDTKKIKAECKNGILTICLPLREKNIKTTTITIE
jgi:HSP20 family molecular chaperone IbpA